MKKILGIVGAAVLALVLASCSKAESNSVKIGGIFPLSGQVAVYGVECKNGVDLAIEEINAAGGINGKPVVLVSEDDEGNPDKTVNAFKKLSTKDGVKVVIGSLKWVNKTCAENKITSICNCRSCSSWSNLNNFRSLRQCCNSLCTT